MILIVMIIAIIIFKRPIFTFISKSKSIKFISKHLIVLLSLLTLFFVIIYRNNNNLGIMINKITSNRIYSINEFYINYGIHLFGNKLVLVSTEMSVLLNTQAYILDNCYANLIIQYGIFVYIMICMFFEKAFKKMYSEKDYSLVLIFILLLIYGVIENSILKISYNIFLLYFSKIIYIEDEGERKIE